MPFIGSGYVLPAGSIVCNHFVSCYGTGCGLAPCDAWGWSLSVDLVYTVIDGIARVILQAGMFFVIGFLASVTLYKIIAWFFHHLTWKRQ